MTGTHDDPRSGARKSGPRTALNDAAGRWERVEA